MRPKTISLSTLPEESQPITHDDRDWLDRELSEGNSYAEERRTQANLWDWDGPIEWHWLNVSPKLPRCPHYKQELNDSLMIQQGYVSQDLYIRIRPFMDNPL